MTCRCGCGQPTPLARRNRAELGHVKGQPVPYLPGHNRRQDLLRQVVEEDRGYDTPCHIWQGAKTAAGYGVVRYHGRITPAHRAVYQERHGALPDELPLDHLCRQHDCINDAHLEPVTTAENTHRGLATKLSATAVEEIRQGGEPHAILALRYGVSVDRIKRVRRGLTR